MTFFPKNSFVVPSTSLRYFFLFLLMAAAPFCQSSIAQAASSGPYSIEVLIDGVDAREYYHRGQTYIEAHRNCEYIIQLSNNSPERVAVALAIDGLNSIDARHTSAASARKWILAPYETTIIRGWQTSNQTTRHFYFTDETGSYGSYVGDTRNLGIISAAFFRERRREPVYVPMTEDDGWSRGAKKDQRLNKGEAGSFDSAGRDADFPAASASGGAERKAKASAPAPSQEFAATGIGRESGNSVYSVAFDQETSPAAVISLRYEYRAALMNIGIIPRPVRPDPLTRRENATGFTDYGFAPDPYRYR